MFEVENGVITNALRPKKRPVEECLKLQGRFKHLFTPIRDKSLTGQAKSGPREEIKAIQAIADENYKNITNEIKPS